MKPVSVFFLFALIFFCNCSNNDDFPVDKIPGFYNCFVITDGYYENRIFNGTTTVTVTKNNDNYDINIEPIVFETLRAFGDTIGYIPNLIIPRLTIKIVDFDLINAYFIFPKTGGFEHGTLYSQSDFFSIYGAADMELRLNLKYTSTEKTYYLIFDAVRYSEK